MYILTFLFRPDTIGSTYGKVYDGELNPNLNTMHKLIGIRELRHIFPYHVEDRLAILLRRGLSHETLAQTAIQEILRISYEIIERKTAIFFRVKYTNRYVVHLIFHNLSLPSSSLATIRCTKSMARAAIYVGLNAVNTVFNNNDLKKIQSENPPIK